MAAVWHEGIVRRIVEIAPEVRTFFVEIQSPAHFEFRAGQFVTFDLPIGEKRAQRWRSYSIANAPMDPEGLEFCIVRSPIGEGTKYFFEKVEIGSVLKFKGPDGAFFLPEKIEQDLVFISTGTGVAPFRSMLLDLKNSGQAHPREQSRQARQDGGGAAEVRNHRRAAGEGHHGRPRAAAAGRLG